MGVVYEAFDPVIGRKVALKTMLIEGLSAGEFQEYKARFQREGQAAGMLAHPNIVTVYDFGEDEGVLYLAMEFLEGMSLQQIVEKQGVLAVETVIPIFEQVSSAIDHAHSHKIVHRDLKPANIMIMDTGLVKVTDFGIAKMMSTRMTQAGQIVATPNYMSPEQIQGQAVDGRSDIFSLGVILYELLTGAKPFEGQNVTTVIHKIVNENPIPPRELNPSIHSGLNYVVQKALAKNPDERFQTCRELTESLRNYRSLGGVARRFATLAINVPPIQATRREPLQPLPPDQESLRAARSVKELPSPPPRKSIGEVELRPAAPAVAPPEEKSLSTYWILLTLLLVGAIGGGGFTFLRMKSQGNETAGNPPAQVPRSAETVVPKSPGAFSAGPAAAIPRPANRLVEAPATAPPPAPPRFGQLLITSVPSGARIRLDGRSEPEWITPFTLEALPPGPHRVRIWKDGFEKAERRVSVEAGRTEPVDVALKPSAARASAPHPSATPTGLTRALIEPSGENAYLMIQTNPPGLEVFIDGKSYGASPVHQILPVGTHSLALKDSGVEVYSGNVVLKAGEVLSRSFRVGQ
jgi:serine/threonine-protein kinase